LEQAISTVSQIKSGSGRGHGVPDNFTTRQNLNVGRCGLGFFEQPAAFRLKGVSVGGFVASMAMAVSIVFMETLAFLAFLAFLAISY